MFIGVGSTFFNNSIFILPDHVSLINAEFLNPFIKLIPVLGSLLGAITALILFSKYNLYLKRNIYIFLSNK